jgi:N-methylhydantoinase B
MPARIIQTNETPFKTVPVDTVTLDIIENALRNARIEMDATLVRTAMSPGIREQGDAFPLIADAQGQDDRRPVRQLYRAVPRWL